MDAMESQAISLIDKELKDATVVLHNCHAALLNATGVYNFLKHMNSARDLPGLGVQSVRVCSENADNAIKAIEAHFKTYGMGLFKSKAKENGL